MATSNTTSLGDIQSFFVELVRRFFSKSPKFFQVINVITGACTLVLGVPAFLEMINIQMQWHVALPLWFNDIKNASAGLITFGMWLTSRLSVNKVAVDTGEGTTKVMAVNESGDKHLPFTQKKEVPVDATTTVSK